MVMQKQIGTLKEFMSSVGKRGWIVVGAIVLIGMAVWLNFALFSAPTANPNDGYEAPSGNDASQGDDIDDVSAYFSTTAVSRQRARDEALEVLQSVVDNENADEASKNQAIADISALAADMNAEANIETLIKAKGFEECIAVINGDNISIVLKSEGILPNQISQINEIVYEQANIKPSNIRIIEK
jgi:stage III sporulation protein AH